MVFFGGGQIFSRTKAVTAVKFDLDEPLTLMNQNVLNMRDLVNGRTKVAAKY